MHSWITAFVAWSGSVGVTLRMIAENVFPPIPSELIMPLAGYSAARGPLSLPLVITAGTLGSVIGALPSYAGGRWLGAARLKRWAARHGRRLTLAPTDVDRAQAAFGRHSGSAVLLGRLVPAVRTLISVPAGVARMAPGRFLAFSALGSLVWTGVLAAAGRALGREYARVAQYAVHGAREQRRRRPDRRRVPVPRCPVDARVTSARPDRSSAGASCR